LAVGYRQVSYLGAEHPTPPPASVQVNRFRAEHNITEVMTAECECRVPSDDGVMVCAPIAVCRNRERKGAGNTPRAHLGNPRNVEFEAVWWRKRK
jgi:hypothetical protein